MKIQKSINCVDLHTGGEPTRIVTGGIPKIKGKTMQDKKLFLQENLDSLREFLMYEPRGHKDMFGAVLTEAVNESSDFGVVFMDGGGYLNMCGHGSVAVVTLAIETGMIEAANGQKEVIFDTPAGTIKAIAEVKDAEVLNVSFDNVPSFLYKKDCIIKYKNYQDIKFDISFGGSFFAIVDISQFDLKIRSENTADISRIAVELREIINKEFEIIHPSLEHIKTVDLVEFYEKTDKGYKNVVIFGNGQIDRSPCGTGTSAKLASLYSRKELNLGEEFIYESILSTKFKGKVVQEVSLGEYKAIIPRISANAYITAFNQFVLSANDPLANGFVL